MGRRCRSSCPLLAAALQLEGAFAVIIVEQITGDVIERIGFFDVAGGFANPKASSTSQSVFSLLRGITTLSSGPTMALVAEENDRLGRKLHASFLGVFLVVEPDANEFTGADTGRSKTFSAPKVGRFVCVSSHCVSRAGPSVPKRNRQSPRQKR